MQCTNFYIVVLRSENGIHATNLPPQIARSSSSFRCVGKVDIRRSYVKCLATFAKKAWAHTFNINNNKNIIIDVRFIKARSDKATHSI